MGNQGKSVLSAVKAALSNSAPLPSASDVEKRIADARAHLQQLHDHRSSVRQERELLKGDPNVTIEALSGLSDVERVTDRQIADAEELISALGEHLYAARERDFVHEKKKRKAEIEGRIGKPADDLYIQLNDHLTSAAKILSELRGLHLVCEAFNKTSDERIGYVSPPEYRIRHRVISGTSAYRPKPLWDELRRIPPVYPGDGYIDVAVETPADSYIELAPPKPPQPPAPAPLLVANDGRGSAGITVHRAALLPEPLPPETDFHGRPLIRTADEASAARDSRDADASPSLARDVHGYGR